jgi:AcrR family transcriptional regulator
LRRAQAEGTRRRVTDAALAQFERHGYAATSITAIASEAGVSPETIYASFATKRGILEALVAGILLQGTGRHLQAAWAAAAGDPGAQLALIAGVARSFWSTNRSLVAVLRQGTGDSELGDIWASRQRDRRALFRSLLATWPQGTLDTRLDVDAAADLVFSLTDPGLYHLLVEERGWTVDRYEQELLALLRRALLPIRA